MRRAWPGSRPAAYLAVMPTPDDPFAAGWMAWRARRDESLRAPDGWLALIALRWLAPGENCVPELPGVFRLEAGVVTLSAALSDGYALDGAPIAERALASDRAGAADRLRIGTRTAQVIERSGALALRIWDAASPARLGFRGVEAFRPDPRWMIAARWEPYAAPREVQVASAAGPPRTALAPGRVTFAVAGRALALEPTVERTALLFVFRDATSGAETYGAGRFLSAELPRGHGVTLDFNRACNPPCAFTDHATCPLAPPGNVLPIRVEAGEKAYARR